MERRIEALMAMSTSRPWRWFDVSENVRNLVGANLARKNDDAALRATRCGNFDQTQEIELPVPDPVIQADDLRRRLEMAQRLETMGRLASGVTHDFHNLLLVIQGYG